MPASVTPASREDRNFKRPFSGPLPGRPGYLELSVRPLGSTRVRNWRFIGSQLAGERASVVMSLLQSAKLNGHDPWAYLKDVLTRLPTQLNSRIEELLPIAGSLPADVNQVDHARCAQTATRPEKNAVSAPTLSQRAAYDTAFDQAASHIFAMGAMLARQRVQLNMPRPDGYTSPASRPALGPAVAAAPSCREP